MASDDALPHGRPSCRTQRAFQDIPLPDQRSFFGSKSSKKSLHKTSGDKLVWFSPVHSPLLSPVREKTPTLKKKVRQSSIFSIQSRGKGSIESEEPTSPKVSCIGQVRAHRKDKDPVADAVKKKSSQSKPGSMSPARFFASPGRASKWGSLFGSRKDSPRSPLGYGEGEVSCLGLPFENRSALQTDKTCDFLARSLDLYEEECRSSDITYQNKVTQSSRSVSDHPLEKQDICASSDGSSGMYTGEELDSCSLASTSFVYSSQQKGTCEMSGIAMASTSDDFDHCQPSTPGNKSHDDHPVKRKALKQKLTYEELPSLHCGAFTKQNLKISVEVVPETWLWRNGERLRPDSTSHLSCIPDRSESTSREDLQKTQLDEPNMPVSPCGNTHAFTRNADNSTDRQILPGQCCVPGSGNANTPGGTNDSSEAAIALPLVGSKCQILDVEDEKKNNAQHNLMVEPCQSRVAASSCCTDSDAVKEKSEKFRSFALCQDGVLFVQSSVGFECEAKGAQIEKQQMQRSFAGCQDGAHGVQSSVGFECEAKGAQNGKQQVHFGYPKNEADVENQDMLGSWAVKPVHQTVRRTGVGVGKENYRSACLQSFEKSLPSLHIKEEGKQIWSILKGRKNEGFPAPPFSALILLGYDQSNASKDMGCKDEELLKGILELGRLSFHGSGKHYQALNSDAAFNRSRSVTSHRTVIRLQRCNSDPCRSSG
ncbi:hypothetical protein L7F22_056068 [Adiantum nelumboides]|nr:hypothetical protein [Adiantum nelumboides]